MDTPSEGPLWTPQVEGLLTVCEVSLVRGTLFFEPTTLHRAIGSTTVLLWVWMLLIPLTVFGMRKSWHQTGAVQHTEPQRSNRGFLLCGFYC